MSDASFEARRLADDPITLEDLSTEFGVSRERVRQIEVRAFEKVQAAVKAGVARAQLPGRMRGGGAARGAKPTICPGARGPDYFLTAGRPREP